MTTCEFDAMGSAAKNLAVADKGVLLAMRQEPKFYISLYQVEGFYVEAYYHIKTRHVVQFKSFTTTDLLYPYLEQIGIAELLPAFKA